MTNRRATRSATAALALACAAAPAVAGVRRDDVADQLYIDLGNDPRYASVGMVEWDTGRACGTLISPTWVLTAGHVTDTGSTRIFTYGGTNQNNGTFVLDASHFAHPNWVGNVTTGWDIGLVRLAAPVTTIAPASRFTGDEQGMIGTAVGFGVTGVGSTGHEVPGEDPNLKRAGTNVLDLRGNEVGWSANVVLSDFDDPDDPIGQPDKNLFGSGTPTDLEYMISFSDSGGGTFVDVGGRSYVAAVHSFISSVPEPDGDGVTNASYSDFHGSTRVAALNAWIDDSIGNHWQTAANGSFATAANWGQGAAPGIHDIAGFNLPGTYSVNFAGNVTNFRLLARRGDVTLNLAGATYTLASTAYEGSLVVGKYFANDARVTFTSGTVNSKDAVLGELPGSIGRIVVGSGATWNCATDVYVGGSFVGAGGTGNLRVNAGGTLAVAGTMTLFGGGKLDLAGGAASAGLLRLTGGTITGSGTFASPVAADVGTADVVSGTLSLTGALTNAIDSTLFKRGAGTLVLAGTQSHGTGAGLHVMEGAAQLNTDAGSAANATLDVTVDGGASAQFNTTQHLDALDVATGASTTLAQSGSRLLSTNSLQIASGGVLNLHDNDLLIDYDGSTIEHAVRAMVTNGRITYDAGAGDVILAIADNTEWTETAFHGESIDGTTIVGKYTYFGDANLDGQVTTDDYVAIDLGLGTGDSWVQGDVDVNGFVSTDDYVVVDLNLGKGSTNPLAFAETQASMIALHTEMFGQSYLDRLAYAQENGFASVPEPTGLAALAAAGTLLTRSRHRRPR